MSVFEEKLVIHSSYCEKTTVFRFWTKADYSCFSCHSNEIWKLTKFLCLLLTACKTSNKSSKRLLRYYTFILLMSCRIASLTSYLSENEAKNLQNGDVHLAQIPDFRMEYLENHLAHWGQWWLIFFCTFTLFHLSLTFFDRSCPLKHCLPTSVAKKFRFFFEIFFITFENIQCSYGIAFNVYRLLVDRHFFRAHLFPMQHISDFFTIMNKT